MVTRKLFIFANSVHCDFSSVKRIISERNYIEISSSSLFISIRICARSFLSKAYMQKLFVVGKQFAMLLMDFPIGMLRK